MKKETTETKRKVVEFTNPPENLETEERQKIKEWVQENYSQYLARIGPMWCDCRDWYEANGKQSANWSAAFRRWIRKHHEYQMEKRTEKKTTNRKNPKVSARTMESISKIFGDIDNGRRKEGTKRQADSKPN